MAQTQFRSDDTDAWLYGFGDGSDGDLTISSNTTEAPIDSSCSGTSGATSLSATNASFATGQLILIHQTRGTGAGNWELNRIASYTAGTITTSLALKNTYTDSGASQAQVRVMKQYNNVTVNSGVTWTGKAWDGNVGGILAFFAKGTIQGQSSGGTISLIGSAGSTISGGSNVSAAGGTQQYNGGAGYSYFSNGRQGEGTGGGGGTDSQSANGNGGGGGRRNTGTSRGGGGGGGGNANSGTAGGYSEGGAGGNSVGSASLVTMCPGGGGGGGGAGLNYNSNAAGGGGGGGIVFIIAKTIDLTYLTINTFGGNGAQTDQSCGGGGGGAGGSVLFKTQVATLGTNKVISTAGTGGSALSAGGNGSIGRIHLDYKTSYTGTTNPTLDYTNDTTLDWPSTFVPKIIIV